MKGKKTSSRIIPEKTMDTHIPIIPRMKPASACGFSFLMEEEMQTAIIPSTSPARRENVSAHINEQIPSTRGAVPLSL